MVNSELGYSSFFSFFYPNHIHFFVIEIYRGMKQVPPRGDKMKKEQIKNDVDLWIAAEDLPQGGLKVIKGFSVFNGMDEDEVEAYLDFRHWYMSKD